MQRLCISSKNTQEFPALVLITVILVFLELVVICLTILLLEKDWYAVALDEFKGRNSFTARCDINA